jgi:hypothetical protein
LNFFLIAQKCRKVVDIVMVPDESGSIGRKNWRKVKKFVRHVISRFSVTPFGAHFAAVKYNNRPRKVFSLTKYTNAKKLRKAVRRMRYRGGGTRTGKALRFTNRRVMIIFTYPFINSECSENSSTVLCPGAF